MHDLLLQQPGRPSSRATWSATQATSGSTASDSVSTSAKRAGAARIAEDVDTADLSGRHRHPDLLHQRPPATTASYDITAITSAVLAAKAASRHARP